MMPSTLWKLAHDAYEEYPGADRENKALAEFVRLVLGRAGISKAQPIIKEIIEYAAGIYAEAQDLNRYPKISHLYRRFGLAVFDGQAEQPKRGKKLGFSPARRAHLYIVADTLIRQRNHIYYKLYADRKKMERAKLTALEKTGTIPDNWEGIKKSIIEKRARRYMIKKFLLHVWQEWRRVTKSQRGTQDLKLSETKVSIASLSSKPAAVN